MGEHNGKKQAARKETQNGKSHEKQFLSPNLGYREDRRKNTKDPIAAKLASNKAKTIVRCH